MLVEVATSESFSDIRTAVAVDALPESDFTAKALIDDLPAGQDIFYRVRFQDLSFADHFGEPQVGRFRTAPDDRRSISFAWSGDTAGQGWGIDLARGGMRTYRAMRSTRPDFFIHSRRQHLRRLPDRARDEAAERRALEQHRHRGEVPGRADARRLSRQLQIQSARRAPARVQRRGAGPCAVGRSRGHQRLVAGPAASQRRIYRDSALLLAARGRRAFREFMPMRETQVEAGRIYRKIAYGPLLDVFLLDMRSYRGPNADRDGRGAGASICSAPPSSHGSSASSAPRARPGRSSRPICRSGSSATTRSPRATARRAAASSRSPTCCPSSGTPG